MGHFLNFSIYLNLYKNNFLLFKENGVKKIALIFYQKFDMQKNFLSHIII